MNQHLNGLIRAAEQAAVSGRWQEAEDLWRQVHGIDSTHPRALYSLGAHALQRGELPEAAALLRAGRAAAPEDPMIPVTLAVVLREQGDFDGEWDAIQDALVIDAYFLPALLAKAIAVERTGAVKAAVAHYRNALRVAPSPERWPGSLKPQLVHAQRRVDEYSASFAVYLDTQLASISEDLSRDEAARWREATSIMAGRSRPYLSDSNQLYVPRLPATPFYDRALFPWAEALEAQTDGIRDELQAALADQAEAFTPYITYQPGEPVNQWGDLNQSTRWSTYSLWRAGLRVEENLARCPKTAAALEDVEMADIGGLCPNAMFSALAPHTRIPPHTGETNARLVVHLPLVVPEHCLYRVGFDERRWRVGEALMFDDTLEHAARNDSDELRVVLIFDVWNPLLSLGERRMVTAMAAASRAFQADD